MRINQTVCKRSLQSNPAAWAIGCLGLLVVGCGSGSAPNADNSQAPAAESASAPATPTEPELFASPTVPSAPSNAPAANKPLPPGQLASGLISTTAPQARVPQVVTGRSDPFASLPATPVITRRPSIPPVPPEESSASLQPPQLIPVPEAPAPLPVVAIAEPPAPPAVAPVPAAPVVSVPQSIQIRGALEMGGRYSIIVEVPGEGSRYVNVGDRVANGSVLVKRVEMSGQEPRVILEHNGQEIIRTVGDSNTFVSRG